VPGLHLIVGPSAPRCLPHSPPGSRIHPRRAWPKRRMPDPGRPRGRRGQRPHECADRARRPWIHSLRSPRVGTKSALEFSRILRKSL
jgi:hypothetical protein